MRADRVYAYLLKTYPASWRTRRGEEVLAVLSQAADARGTARPDLREAASLLVNGLRERVGLLPALLTPFARELASTSALTSLAALALLCLGLG